MRRTVLVVALSLTCSLTAFAQRTETKASGQDSNETTASKAGKTIQIQSGTRLAAELQNTIDARKVKPGDRVVLRTTESIKSHGRTVVNRGARLIGHVTEVEQKTGGNEESHIGLVFDRLTKGSLEIPISATITSLTRGRTQAQANGGDLFGADADGRSMSSARSTTSAQRSSASSGGSSSLLGGATSTVGGVVSSTTSTVGGVVDGTTATVGSAVSSTAGAAGEATTGLGGSLSRIHISESSSTSAEGSSTLSLQGGNVRVEKGTTFNLVVNQSANASTQKDQ